MDHMDEQIQQIKNEYKKYEKKDIRDKVYIGEKEYEFEDVTLFDGKVSIRIPKDFTDMPIAIAKLKYPCEQRPQVIKTNDNGDINVTLSLLNEQLKKENVEQTKNGIKNILERMNPAYIFFQSKTQEKDDLTVGYFQFKSNAIDSDLYNLMFITPIEGITLLGTFICQMKDREDWEYVGYQMMMSVKDLTLHKEDK